MHHNWIKGLSDGDAMAVKREYKQAILLRERLVVLLENKIAKSLSEMRDVVNKGEIVNINEYLIDELGRQRTLEDVIKLIKE